MSGVDIPIPELQITMHQPTIKEISMLGNEQSFFSGIQVLCIDKRLLLQDKSLLENTSNFQIFMAIMNDKQTINKKEQVLQTFTLLFPKANVLFTPRSIVLKQNELISTIDEGNFEILQQLLNDAFCLQGSGQEKFNPQGDKATEIAQKLMRARERVAKQKQQSEGSGGSIFSQYISTLVIGTNTISLKDALDLTMYQLYDLVERYTLYLNWDLDIRQRLAGGTPDKPAENWMKNIH